MIERIVKVSEIAEGVFKVGSVKVETVPGISFSEVLFPAIHAATGSPSPVLARVRFLDGRTKDIFVPAGAGTAGAQLPNPATASGPVRTTVDPSSRPDRGAVGPRRPRWVWIATLAGILIVALVVVMFVLARGNAPTEASATPQYPVSLPAGFVPLAGAGGVVIGNQSGLLVFIDAATGKELTYSAQSAGATLARVAPAKPEEVLLVAGDGAVAMDSTMAVTVIKDGSVDFLEGKRLLSRSRFPVLYTPGNDAKAPEFFLLDAQGDPAPLPAGPASSVVFGAVRSANAPVKVVYAIAGAKIAVRDGETLNAPVSLVPPVPGATISGWVTVTATAAVVQWKAPGGIETFLAAHDLVTGKTIGSQQKISAATPVPARLTSDATFTTGSTDYQISANGVTVLATPTDGAVVSGFPCRKAAPGSDPVEQEIAGQGMVCDRWAFPAQPRFIFSPDPSSTESVVAVVPSGAEDFAIVEGQQR
ncbi:hypothetical protein [Staphylococcus aureus]|uniref:hypothetical protein n=1 Tax=Staphylococcus aureus TaxID=1280 RepID=UPI003219592A